MGAFRDFFIKLYEDGIKEPLIGLADKITSAADRVHDWNYIYGIEIVKTVSQLESKWAKYPEHARTDPEVIAAYETKKEELTAQGLVTTADYALGFVGTGIAKGVKHITVEAYKNLMPTFEALMAEAKLSEESRANIRSIAASGEFGLNAIISFLLGVTLYPAISTATAPAWRIAEHGMDAKIHSNLLPPDLLTHAKWRGIIKEDQFTGDMLKYGYTPEDVINYEHTSKFYPQPQDFIRFAVRDTYNEEVVKKYGYDLDYPDAIDPYVAQAGMTPEWLKHYWRAHWELPSPNQTFEMVHRRKITLDDARTILRIADIAPYFIEPLISIAYNPVTRVDLRRLYQGGEYTEEQVYEGYLDLGSSPEIARALTNWTTDNYAPAERDLAKEEVLKNYRIGQVSAEEVKNLLTVLDYTEDQVTWILVYEDYKVSASEVIESAEVIITELINGIITLKQGETMLDGLKLSQKAKNQYIERAKREVRKLQHLPSIDTLKTWYKASIIDVTEFRLRMEGHKVTSKDIQNYIAEVGGK